MPKEPISIVPPAVDMSTPPKSPSQVSGKAYQTKQKELSFYKLNRLSDVEPDHPNYRISKFDSDLNVISSYQMTYIPSNNGGYYDCNCPASKFDCRHKAIQRAIIQAGMVDSNKFYCFDAGTFKVAEEIV